MDTYFDSAIVVKLYIRETTSPEAVRLVGAYRAPNGHRISLIALRPRGTIK
jgi:hypothetical protein